MDVKRVVSVLVALLLVAPAYAQEGSQGEGGSAAGALDLDSPQGVQQQLDAQQRMKEIRQELTALQAQTLEKKPELQQRADALDERLLEQMEQTGYEGVREDMARLEETVTALEEGSLSKEEERSRLAADRKLQQALRQAYQEAIQDPSFSEEWQADHQALRQELIAAMEEQSPRAGELIDELRQLQAQLPRGGGAAR